MSGRRNNWWARSAVLLLVLLFVDWGGMAGGGPTRASGTDIVVTDITSHTDGSTIGMTSQTVTATIDNEGTDFFSPDVRATLTVYYPANETSMSVFFINTTDLGSTMGQVGNSTSIIFPQWIPNFEGYYAINVSIDAADDHLWNNSKNVTVRAMIGNPVDLTIDVNDDWKVIKPGESTSNSPNTPFVFRIRNDGMDADSFTLDFESLWLEPGWANSTGVIQPGMWSSNIYVNVMAPGDAKPPEFDILVCTATSDKDTNVSKQRAVEIKLLSKSGVSITVIGEDPQVVYPGGEWVIFDFLVTNTGDRTDDYEISVKTRPTNWQAQLIGSPYIRALEPGSSRFVRARVKIPPLNFDTMEEDNTYRGDTGALILKASSPMTLVEGTGEGHIYVGLVHTVEVEVSPPNSTLPWDPNVIQNLTFDLNITSVNNIRNGVGIEMDVNLSMPEGKYGVLFYPVWDEGRYNETESKRWTGSVAPRVLHLESGETSFGSRAEITAPPFPFQGTAVGIIEATPLLEGAVEGLALTAREMVRVFVRPELQFKVEPPRKEFYPKYNNGSLNDDVDLNGVPDWQEAAPGETLRLPFNLTNIGNTADFYEIFADAIPRSPAATLPDDWTVNFPAFTPNQLIPFWYDPLNPQHSLLIWVLVTVPLGAPIGETAEIKVEVTSIYSKDPDFRSEPLVIEASIDIFVIQGFGLDLEPEESSGYAKPDETIKYRLNITNIGNGVDSVKFIPMIEAEDLNGWRVEFNVSDMDLAPMDRHTIEFFVTPSLTASADDVLAVKVRAQSLLNPATFDEVWVNTTVVYVGGVMLDLRSMDTLIWRQPGEIATFRLRVTNTGNGDDTFQIDLELGSDKWAGVIEEGDSRGQNIALDISRGGYKDINVSISLPSLVDLRSRLEIEEMMILAETKVANYVRVFPHNAHETIAERELTVGVLQMYKADLYLAPSETRNKDVLVGEEVTFKLIIKNRGNGDDDLTAIHSSPQNSFKHLSWTYLDSGPFTLRPFGERLLNLSIEPDPEGLPIYGERIDIKVEGLAGDGVVYRTTNVSAQIVLTKLVTDMSEVDLGEEGTITIRICNMPAPGSDPRLGFPDQKSFNISSAIDLQTVTGTGWSMPMPAFDVILIDLYQLGDIDIPIRAPPDLLGNSEYASIDVKIKGPSTMSSSHRTMARAVYFDAGIDVHSTRFQNLYESRTGKAYIRLVTTGTRGQDVIPVVVMVGGEVIGEYDAGPAYPQDYGSGEQEIIFAVEFELPTLKWYEKGQQIELEVVIDPENRIVENTVAGRSLAETNNQLSKEFIIKNYTPHVAVLILSGLMLLAAAVAGVMGFFYMDKKNSWYLLPLSIGLSGLFAMLFYVPLEESGLSLDVANGFGMAIIAIDIFFIIPVMVYLYTRAGDSYILHLINTRRGREIIEGQEVTPDIIKPLLISAIGGLLIILIPALYWVIPSEMNKGFKGVMNAFFGFNGTIPVWVPVLLIPVLAVALQMVLIQLKRGALGDIERTWDNLERLKAEIEEGFK